MPRPAKHEELGPRHSIVDGLDRPGTSNGTTEAINGRLEHLRGSALGFRNLTNYIADALSRPAGSRPDYTPDCEGP
jgi:transposase